MFSNIPT